ncbi:MAG: hypothetical protein O7H39_13280, partial [Gammaproteobacteria bacterium]|nr:hypothetical protein [Gammaproteobacteria bacterium]
DYIESLAVRYIPDEAVWVEYRERWQADFLALYALRDDAGAFQQRLIEISIHFEDWQSDEYRAVTANNEALVRDATVGISQMLTERQHAKLSRKLLSIAEDLEELVEELPEQPPEDVCLVLCRTGTS